MGNTLEQCGPCDASREKHEADIASQCASRAEASNECAACALGLKCHHLGVAQLAKEVSSLDRDYRALCKAKQAALQHEMPHVAGLAALANVPDRSPPAPAVGLLPPALPSPSASGMQRCSGHTPWRRFRFSYCLVGPWVAIGTIAFGKDLYLLEFGASARMMGLILFLGSFVCTISDGVAGTIQDRGVLLWRCFPLDTWGRRAPWFLTHDAVLALLVAAFFLPPSFDQDVLICWFTVVWLLGYWCIAASVNAFEAARVEIYPFQEERVNVEQYCKLTVGMGMFVGAGGVFLCLTFPGAASFVAAGLLGCLMVLSGLAATPVLREAHFSAPQQLAFFGSVRALLRSGVVLRMMVLRGLQGVYETLLPSLQLHYYTFVFKLGKGQRMLWFAIGAVLMGLVDLVLAPFWARRFARSSRQMLYLPVALRVADAVVAPAMLFASQDVRIFIAYTTVWRTCNSAYSYWRIAACCWACDLDAGGREGLLLGLFTMVNNLGRALATALAVLGLEWSGLVTMNCLGDDVDDKDQCEHDKIHDQPESLRTYLVMMVAVVAPFISLVICALTLEFPIRPGSQMLKDLCKRQLEMLAEQQRAGPAGPPSTPLPKIVGVDVGKASMPKE